MRPFAPLLLLALLAGCAAPGAQLAPTSVDTLPLAFGDVVAMEQPTSGAEPNIAMLPDGTLFIAAVAGSQERPNALEGAAWLWRSTDDGATWETLRMPMRETPLGSIPNTRRPFGSSDADVVTSPDGWVYYTDWWNWGTPVYASTPLGALPPRAGNYMVERSSDGGETWSSTPVTIPDPTSIDRQWLVAGEGGFVGLFYAYFHPLENALPGPLSANVMSIKAVFSGDHGASWSQPVTVVPPERAVGYQIAHPFLLPDGTLAMPYGRVAEAGTFWTDPSEVRLAVSADKGETWTQRVVAQVPAGFDNLWAVQGAADAQGRIVVAWAHRAGETMPVSVAESADAGETWSAPIALRAEGLNFLPWVAAGADGRFGVAWYGGNATGDPVEAPEDAEWFAYVAVRDADGAWRAMPATAPVKAGPLCPRGAACASDRELLDYPSLLFDREGDVHLAFAVSREVNGGKAGLVAHVASLPQR